MGFLSWIISGLVVGALARLLMPGRQSMGCLGTILLGVVGSIVGGGINWLLFVRRGHWDPWEPVGWIMSILGAIIVLAIGNRRRRL